MVDDCRHDDDEIEDVAPDNQDQLDLVEAISDDERGSIGGPVSDGPDSPLVDALSEEADTPETPAKHSASHRIVAAEPPGQVSEASLITKVGAPDKYEKFWKRQGQNDFGFTGTCGVASGVFVLRQYGAPEVADDERIAVTEKTMLEFMEQVELSPGQVLSDGEQVYDYSNRDGWVTKEMLDNDGATTLAELPHALNQFHLMASVRDGLTCEQLPEFVRNRQAVILAVNAGPLHDTPAQNPKEFNHAVCLTGAAMNPAGKLLGFFINDSGASNREMGAGRFVEIDTFRECWERCGGIAVVCERQMKHPTR
jgi:hypothetical protein